MKRDYHPHSHDSSADEVNFDMSRMKKAVEDERRFVLPEGMPREDFREWMLENANKCRTK
jgi:hypothetical protein